MDKTILIPNKSIGIFHIGDNIKKYINLTYRITRHNEDEIAYDSYQFDELGITLWVEENKINSIRCTKECIWKNKNLINMNFDDFLLISNQEPDKKENIYLLVNDRGQNQMVYDFNKLGLQIWVWREKIRTVIVSNYNEIDD